jgi:glutathione synthase/RimK-type ligase-like ATP-grasp enzyme
MKSFDAVILTDARYINPAVTDCYVSNVLKEDGMVKEALEKRGLKVGRQAWDDPGFDWSSTRYVIFRTTWDYFERYPEFSAWLERINPMTSMINPCKTIRWNLDKHYLGDLQEKGLRIPPTLFIETGDPRSLSEITASKGWTEMILKPAISGGARHTYRFRPDETAEYDALFRELIGSESMMLQEFQQSVPGDGELAFMVFGGKYSHAILKKARAGDFRVQDDFGGSVHDHKASLQEIGFAEKVVSICDPLPVYARVDVIRDNLGEACVSELELIEPELWFRKYPPAAEMFADSVMNYIYRR